MGRHQPVQLLDAYAHPPIPGVLHLYIGRRAPAVARGLQRLARAPHPVKLLRGTAVGRPRGQDARQLRACRRKAARVRQDATPGTRSQVKSHFANFYLFPAFRSTDQVAPSM